MKLLWWGMLCVIIASGIALGIVLLPGNAAPNIDVENYNAHADKQYWLTQMQKHGPHDAYAAFVAQNATVHAGVQHVRAHVIGEALFETLGVEGIAVCDSHFGFGCFHGVFTFGFAIEGDTFVEEADRFCVEKYGVWGTGCQHGIGHGIVEYVGRERLNDALLLCEQTSQPTPLLGCTSGVFMEHNTPFTVIPGIEPVPPYPYSDEQPYGRCEEMPTEYKESCYYELGGWWEVVLQGNKVKMGELCDGIEHNTYRVSCAMGVGNITGPTSEYSPRVVAQTCDQMPSRIQPFCYAGAAWSLYANPEHTSKALSVCEQANSDTVRDICTTQYNLAGQ